MVYFKNIVLFLKVKNKLKVYFIYRELVNKTNYIKYMSKKMYTKNHGNHIARSIVKDYKFKLFVPNSLTVIDLQNY